MTDITQRFLEYRNRTRPAQPSQPTRVAKVTRVCYVQDNRRMIEQRLKAGEAIKSIARDLGVNYIHLTKVVKSWGRFVWMTTADAQMYQHGTNQTEDQGSRASPVRESDGRDGSGQGLVTNGASTEPVSFGV